MVGKFRERVKEDSRSMEQLALLVERQAKHLPSALQELRSVGHKRSHYAWWLFPTGKPGRCEPWPPTCVTPETAPLLLADAPAIWRELLEEVANRGYRKVLPKIDHGRVVYFIQFWKKEAPPGHWLHPILDALQREREEA